MIKAKIINGKDLATNIKKGISAEVKQLKVDFGLIPGLAVVIIGKDKASELYVKNKQKACKEVGIYSEIISLPENTSESDILDLIQILNQRKDIHGVLVQLPVPKHIDEYKIASLISQYKDVDAFHPFNIGQLMIGQEGFVSCTPQGILEMIKSEQISLIGKECVIIGSSNIVGKPLAMLLINNQATVTVCNIFTKDLKYHCKKADILISATGKPKLITADMVKENSVIIDVGMNRDEKGKLCGDVDFEPVSEIVSYITPVPGGVGPMTVTMLLKNTLYSAKKYISQIH